MISSWRPELTDWLVNARELARTLESVVKDDAEAWTATPIHFAMRLHHPTYINHYLRALASLAADHELPVDELVDLVKLIRTHPWEVVVLGGDNFAYDVDWRGAEGSGVELLRALANSKDSFGNRANEVWTILEAEVMNRAEPSTILDPDELDPYEVALNRPCTRALQAVLSFMANEFAASSSVRPEAITLLESSLQLTGRDGAEHRAILAPRIGFLRHVLPDWVEAKRELLFGSEAPEGLGQLMIDQAVKWARPNEWLITNFGEMVRSSVKGEKDGALDHLLLAMLWEWPGYSVKENVAFLQKSPTLVSSSGEAVGRLLRSGEVEQRHLEIAVEFWRAVLKSETGLALKGFGWFAEVESMDSELWAELTLETLQLSGGVIDRGHGVAERAMGLTPSRTSLAIVNELVRGQIDNWGLRVIAERAVDLLSAAQSLEGMDEYKRLQTAFLERGMID